MLHFAWPWMFVMIPLPWILHHTLEPATPAQSAALQVPFIEEFSFSEGSAQLPRRWIWWLAIVAWALLVAASARPQWLGDPIELPVSGRDLMLAVDLSGSMEQQDFMIDGHMVNRLDATKQVAGDFVERRVGDRIGLLLFGEQAYLQTPLTFDRQTVKTLLDEAMIGIAGETTAIGDVIGLAVKRLREQEDVDRVLVLITDGANTAGAVDPLRAAEFAAQHGLTIYTIGMGADEIILRGFFGDQRINSSIDLDEATLYAIAEKTGGRYFRARETIELEQIYNILDRLEPVERDVQNYRPHTSLYPWPLSIAVLFAIIVMQVRMRTEWL